jgi:hypothetical protein
MEDRESPCANGAILDPRSSILDPRLLARAITGAMAQLFSWGEFRFKPFGQFRFVIHPFGTAFPILHPVRRAFERDGVEVGPIGANAQASS